MGIVAWTMVGLALWHFTVFIPDRFWGGIVGAFVGALMGSIVFGLIVNGFSVPGNKEMTVLIALQGVPGSVIGMGLIYWLGIRKESKNTATSI